LRGDDLVAGQDRPEIPQRVALELPAHDLAGAGLVGVADANREGEPVELTFRERIRPVVLDGVLGRDHEVGVGELMGDALHRDLALLHRFEEGRLRPRRRPVDLVDEHDVREDRPGDEAELPVRLVVHADPGHIARQEVGRRLDPAERARDGDRERPRERRLPDPGHALEEQVPVGEQADRRRLDGVVVPGDDPLDVLDQSAERRGCLVEGPPRLDHA
jgi:hypothetical protein